MTSPETHEPRQLPEGESSRDARRSLSRRALLGGGAAAAVGVSLAVGLAPLTRGGARPSFGGATAWLKSAPLGSAELRGHVVLVSFWTFTCINWVRTAPHLRAWSHRYRDDGLVVVGVHTPEFGFERDIRRVRRATRERGIDFPVAVDNDHEIWRSFNNEYWPALYFLDEDGAVRGQHFGEGSYEESERLLQRLLGVTDDVVSTSVRGSGVEAAPDWAHLRTPETYLGYSRSTNFAFMAGGALDKSQSYELPVALPPNQWGLEGEWIIGGEKVSLGRAGGSIVCRFHARDLHLVMSPGTHAPIPFRVLLDGEVPGADHGVDVDAHGNGLLREGRLYQLASAHDSVHERVLDITFDAPGAEAYAFTFG